MTLEGKTAFITGGGRGIGGAIAEAFARSGANLVLLARTGSEIERVASVVREQGIRARALVADVSRWSDVERAAGAALAEFGRIDILVNCAGIYGPIGLLVENNLDEWREAIEMNLMGTVYCMRAILPHMIGRRNGVVINMSGGGAVAPFPRFSAYGTSKAAVVRLTETVAEEVREFNIRVNAIAPGAVNTRLLDEVLIAGEKAGKEFYTKSREQKEKGGVSPTKAAELALFLASPESEGITGRLISAVWDDWKTFPARQQILRSSSLFTLRRIDGRQFTERE